MTSRIELSAGIVEYTDSGRNGPVLVLLHGLMMDASLWDEVIADLSSDHRCVAPTLPLGAHRVAMHADADLSLPGIARLVAEFCDRLGLDGATLVGNDTGGALVQLLMTDTERRAPDRVVLASCDAFDNFPPGLTGKTLVASGRLSPAMFGLFMQQMRPVLTQPEIRRDTVRVLRAAAAAARAGLLTTTAERLAEFKHPALVVWAKEDLVMPRSHGPRLAGLIPAARLVEVDDSYTLIPLDQPARFASVLREFTSSS
jgi:pimeloyl-ACP methyl ester carboxylesterase